MQEKSPIARAFQTVLIAESVATAYDSIPPRTRGRPRVDDIRTQGGPWAPRSPQPLGKFTIAPQPTGLWFAALFCHQILLTLASAATLSQKNRPYKTERIKVL